MQKVVTISQFTRSDQSNHTKTEQESYKSYHIQIGYVSNQEYRNGERNAWNAGNVGNVIFPGMSPNIPGNVAKHSGECRQTFQGMSPNIPGNIIKNSGERRQTFLGMLPIFGVKGRVAFRILSNIHDGAYLRKQPTALIR